MAEVPDPPALGVMVDAKVEGKSYFGRVRAVRMEPTVVIELSDRTLVLLPMAATLFETVPET